MTASLFALAWPCVWPPLFGAAWSRLFPRTAFYEGLGCAAFGGVLNYGISWQPVPLAISALQLLLAVLLWWWSRRRRKRAPRAYGAKSRALLAAVARKAREVVRARPVLRPSPGGVRV